MKNAPFWIVDAFVGHLAGRELRGNPAAVVLLDEWAPDAAMQERANEFNLAETAFVVPRGDCAFDLRWMTPQVEVNLCGHATLAAARALLDAGRLDDGETARFATRSGELTAKIEGARIELDFPAQDVEERAMPEEIVLAFGWEEARQARRFEKLYPCFRAGDDWLVSVHEVGVEYARPDLARLARLDARGVILTAPPEWGTDELDFMSRFFAPRVGIPEDPVTGSAHCALAPFWAKRLGKTKLSAVQMSPRGGRLELEVRGTRVAIAGAAALRARGTVCS